MAMRYEIEAGTNVVKAFYGDDTVPSLLQPTWPDQTPWADAAEATAWAELYVASVNDESAPYAPIKRGESGRAKPTAEQKAAIVTARKSLEDATTPEAKKAAREAVKKLFSNN